jgi:hypothetical protein
LKRNNSKANGKSRLSLNPSKINIFLIRSPNFFAQKRAIFACKTEYYPAMQITKIQGWSFTARREELLPSSLYEMKIDSRPRANILKTRFSYRWNFTSKLGTV